MAFGWVAFPCPFGHSRWLKLLKLITENMPGKRHYSSDGKTLSGMGYIIVWMAFCWNIVSLLTSVNFCNFGHGVVANGQRICLVIRHLPRCHEIVTLSASSLPRRAAISTQRATEQTRRPVRTRQRQPSVRHAWPVSLTGRPDGRSGPVDAMDRGVSSCSVTFNGFLASILSQCLF